jgi:hypothetical protein
MIIRATSGEGILQGDLKEELAPAGAMPVTKSFKRECGSELADCKSCKLKSFKQNLNFNLGDFGLRDFIVFTFPFQDTQAPCLKSQPCRREQ